MDKIDVVPPFVKKFDFRGIYGKAITDADAYYLGKALIKTIPLKKILLGWDSRESSKNLALNFINGLRGESVEIFYMDKCPIDYIAAGAEAFDFDLSIMFTGSHSPWYWTGLLMHTKGGDSVQGDTVKTIIEHYYEASKEPYEKSVVDLSGFKNFYTELETAYEQKLKTLLPLGRIKELKVLVDLGDGSGSRSLSLLEKLLPQVKFARINDRGVYDGSSTHIADPSEVDNMKELMIDTKKGGYDCGFAFDSDADRVLGVDEEGNYLNGSLLGSAMIESFTTLGFRDKLFGYSVDCGPAISNSSQSFPVPVGRSVLRRMIRDDTLDFGVENVGHFYAKDFFMTDSGTFSIAVILHWMSINGKLSGLKEKYPDGEREQIFIPVSPEEKDNTKHLYEEINKKYKNEKKIEVDGLRYEFVEENHIVSWYALRHSGYEQIEKFYFGSLRNDDFIAMKKTFEALFEARRIK